MSNVYVLGGYQTDFARNWMKEGLAMPDLMQETVNKTLEAVKLSPEDVGVGHVGNFAGELYAKQGHLGAFLIEGNPALYGLPTARHEAACASGSIALLAASAEIEAGRYDVALVLGIEHMKTVDPQTGGDFLGTAAWYEQEAKDVEFAFPRLFGQLRTEYEKRFGLDEAHLNWISDKNFENARRNPLAQTREWAPNPDKMNQRLVGPIRVRDCSQVTDGAVAVVLASEEFAREHARRTGTTGNISKINGWGHRTATMRFEDKMRESEHDDYVLPHTRQAIQDAFRRAGIGDVYQLDAIETHDCFTSSEYMAIDHFGITPPGKSWQAIEEGTVAFGGKLPMNPSGGLIGVGHPVGATGVRQMLDAHRQVTATAGAYQVEGASRVATLNLGGSGTTSVCFVLGGDLEG